MSFETDSAKAATGFLTGGGSTTQKFPYNGFSVTFTLIRIGGQIQQTDMNTGEPKYFVGRSLKKESELRTLEGARPAMQLILEFQGPITGKTWETNQYIEKALPDDDGVRTLYVSGKLQQAMGKALLDAKLELEVGQEWTITRTGAIKAAVGVAFTYDASVKPGDPNAVAANQFMAEGATADPFA